MDSIRIRGARTHNLKNIDVDLPRGRLTVVTGLSGSGKSSLAFDTLYAEGQRRYVESLSAYARQFLQLMDKPDVDRIEGLSPAISIEQKAASHNPRSTVGTVTEIHDYLRLLYARAGTPYCPDHPQHALAAQSVAQMVDAALALPADTRALVLAPVVHDRKGSYDELFADLRTQGFVRFRIDGAVVEAEDLPPLARSDKHTIDVVVDRLKVRPEARQRLAESFETALRVADGRALLLDTDNGLETVFSSRFACPICGFSLAELEPRLFSFNNPAGACPSCDGLGTLEYFDPQRVVAHPELSLAAGAIRGWDRRNAHYYAMLETLARRAKLDLEAAWESLTAEFRALVLHGSGEEKIPSAYVSDKGRKIVRPHVFEGVLPTYERRWRETDSPAVREELAKLRAVKPCPACDGARLNRAARHVFVGEGEARRAIYELERLPLATAHEYFTTLELPGNKREIGARILREIGERLRFLTDVGLTYLTLDRAADTLSGGESQRIRLASQIGSGLTGVLYVLDEPSIGLHQRDNARLIATLKHLRDLGNTVLVVEHDEDAIRAADHVVDMGPGAGEHGGRVVAAGTPAEVEASADSLTGAYLSGRKRIAVPAARVPPGLSWLTLAGCTGNNLKHVTLQLPVGLFVCVTGVSGSGKSTLVNDTLAAAVAQSLYGSAAQPAPHEAIDGLENFDKLVLVDQSPIGRTPRSNPATYTGLFGPIRELFAQTPTARERGYDAGRFSFNVKGGRCETCQGDGLIEVEMHFLPDVYVACDSCHGRRYNRETLEVRYKGLTIADVLDLTVAQAAEFFRPVPGVARKLDTLLDVGLGYVRLGQSATTLSGGEAQRVKLALDLSKRDTGRTLYVLDEPTTGLHFHDIELLLAVLHRLREAGNTVVVIEHNLDVIKTADWVIDLGPEGGDGGGSIVAAGAPEAVAGCDASHTGKYLAQVLRSSARSG
jgi:excinuclease ABC subunit A